MKRVPDLVRPGLSILFCGINPGLTSARIGHNFGRPGNRFWPALHRAGLTPRQLAPAEEHLLLDLGMGITNFVDRESAAADELSNEEIRAGARELVEKVGRLRPRVLAVLGVGAYRIAFDRKKAKLGKQAETIGDTEIWVLPNPSGLNAHYTLPGLTKLFAELRAAVTAAPGRFDDQAVAGRDADESRVR